VHSSQTKGRICWKFQTGFDDIQIHSEEREILCPSFGVRVDRAEYFKWNYRVFHLKRNPNYYTWTPSPTKRQNQWQYWILAAVSHCCSWCTVWNRYGRNLSCFVTQWALVTDKHFLCPEILLPFGVLSCSYFLVRIRIAKCFTDSSKRFRC
jgi:hypothetical protein